MLSSTMPRRPLVLTLLLLGAAIAFYLVVLRGDDGAARRTRTSTTGKDTSKSARGSTGHVPLRTGGDDPRAPRDRKKGYFQGGRRLIDGRWGGDPGKFGRLKARESNPEGPMAFATDGKGNVTLLDQVNGRLQRFGADGRFISAHPIGTNTAQDVAFDADGNALVLDRLGKDPAIKIFDQSGNAKGSIALLGGPVEEGGDVSGVFSDSDGIYVEVGHDSVVRIADGQGNPVSTRDTVPGRPTRDGKLYIKAGLLDKATGRVFVQAHGKDQKLVWERALNLGGSIAHILLLDSDKAGNVYLAAEVLDDPGPPERYKTPVARLEGAQGKLTGQLILPATTAEPSESFRPLTVGDDGTIYQLLHTPNGPTVTAYRFE